MIVPGRREVFKNGGYYHVFNKTIDDRQIFVNGVNTQLFLDIIRFYRAEIRNISFSQYLHLPEEIQNILNKKITSKKYHRVKILCYSLMPNHFHFLLKQTKENGIQSFMANIANSFTRFLNTKSKRTGPFFLPRFKAVVIHNHEQLIHTSRYIHLNHYSSGILRTIEDIDMSSQCSYSDYVKKRKSTIADTNFILGLFNNDRKLYKKFTEDHADYQRTIESIKHAQKWS